jgi:hypothetical protein
MTPVRSRVLLWSLPVVFVVASGAGALWLQREHTIVYRGAAGACAGRVTISERGDRRTVHSLEGPFERRLGLRHGDSATVIVQPERGCPDPARCEIEEDGAIVSRATGRVAASCSANTAR